MKRKSILLGALVIAVGAVSATAGVVASENKEQLSINAEEINDTVGYVRIWVGSDNNGPIDTDGCLPKLWFHTGNGNDDANKGQDVCVSDVMQNYQNNAESYRDYYYADVPVENIVGSYLSVQRFHSNGTQFKDQTQPILVTLDNITQVFYVWNVNEKTNGNIGISTGTIGSVGANMAAKALEGLQTCSSSAVNGYNAFKGIGNTFIHDENGEWKTQGELSSCNIQDYATTDDYLTNERTVTIDAYDKYLALQAASGMVF